MDVQRVHSEVIGVHFQGVEHLFEGDLLPALLQDHTVCLGLVGGFDELEQMFLVHASGCVDVCVYSGVEYFWSSIVFFFFKQKTAYEIR